MRKLPHIFSLLLLFVFIFSSCSLFHSGTEVDNKTDEGVVINGIRWATRNVDMPGTFAANPEDAGMFFQWNRRKGWAVTGYEYPNSIPGWDNSTPTGTAWYAENDPCPEGWRVPTREELESLYYASSEWTTKNGVNGRLFGIAPNQLFLPAARCRYSAGALSTVGGWGCYWSSSANSARNGWFLHFFSGGSRVGTLTRVHGFSVRCVSK